MSTATDHLSDHIKKNQKTTTVIFILFIIAFLIWVIVDTSDVLNQEQSLLVRDFVLRTHSDHVRERFNETVKDGKLTVNETKSLIEVAKKEDSGYGLISD